MTDPSHPIFQWRVPLDGLSEACRAMARELSLNEGENRRVQWDPQPRLIRYYTSTGLLSRPHERRGKVAYYGLIHLLQLLTIKQLQSQGLSLLEVQQRLLGASPKQLLHQLDLPENWVDLISGQTDPQRSEGDLIPPSEREQFWLNQTSAPLQVQQASLSDQSLTVRVRFPNGIEVLIPWEVWQKSHPGDWNAWLDQAPCSRT